MVKNLPTVERSTKIRFGKNCTEDQGENTIVFNASNVQIDATQPGAVYMTPIRKEENYEYPNFKMLIYNVETKEIAESNVTAEEVINMTLEDAVINGNVTSNTVSFNNAETSVTTLSNVGIANGAPLHTLDVGTKFYVDEEGANVLTVLGDTYLQDDVVIGGNLDVRGTLTTINTENTTIKDAIIEIGKGNTTSDMGVIMDRTGTNVTMGYREGVDEFVIAHTTSSATSSTITPSSELIDARVHGRLHVNSNLTVDTDTLHVDAIRDRVGINTLNPQTDLDVVGNAHVRSDFTVDTDTLFVDASTDRVGINTLTPSTDFHVEGEAYVSGNVTVDTDTFHVDTVNDRVGINTLTPSTDFHVEGDTYVSGNVDVQTNLNVLTDAVVTGNAYMLSNVVVTGNTDVQSELNVTGNAFVSSNLNAESELNVTGNAFVSSNVVVTGNTDVQSELNVTGNAFVSSNVVVTGNTDVQSELNVTGNTFVSSNLNAQSELNVTGNAFVSSNVVVTGNTDVQSELNVTGNAFVFSNLNAESELNVTGNAFVFSNLNAQSELNVTGNAFVFSNLNAQSELNVTGNAYVSSNVVVTGNVDVQTDVNVTGNAYATGYYGDGGLLSNVNLQVVSDHGNATSNTIQFTNPTTAFTTDLTSNVEVKLDQLNSVNIDGIESDHILVYDGTDWVNEYPMHTYIKIRNDESTATIEAGDAVYVKGTHNANILNVGLAKSDSATTMPCIGLSNQQLTAGQQGTAVAYGKALSVVTNDFITGETVYVSNTVPGGLSNVKPYDNALIQNVGVVTKIHESNGAVFVTGIGRANDIPNAPIVLNETDINYVYVNDQNNDLKKIEPSNLLTQLQTFQQVTDTQNTTSNVVQFTNATTGLVTTSNIEVGDRISIGNLTADKIPIVGTGNFLENSSIGRSNGTIVISSDLEVLGNIVVDGNSYVVESNSLVINDRIIGIANNNVSHELDVGIIMQHPGKNIALIHHGESQGDSDPHDHTFTIGYTQNTVTDNHVFDDSNLITVEILGNLITQNNLTVSENITVVGTTSLQDSVGIANTAPIHDLDVGSNLYVDDQGSNVLHVTGNVYATRFVGDGAFLENIASNLHEITTNGNVTTNTVQFDGSTALVATGSVGIANTAPIHDLDVGSNLYVDDQGSNVVHVTGNVYATRFVGDGAFLENIASNLHEITTNGNVTTNTVQFDGSTALVTTGNVGIANAAPDHELSVTGNVYVSSEVNVVGGLVTNLGGLTKKTYGYSAGTITASTTPEINVVFDSQLFSAKITAHLVEPTSNISVLNLDVTGGTGRNIGKGFLSIVGDQNSKHWNSTINTTSTTVTLTPSVGLLSNGTYGVHVEYTSPLGTGGVVSIDKNNTNEITFDY
jgi:carbonic anhydrase/acetyltransferase-like protein (isoleucine patch superfamily)